MTNQYLNTTGLMSGKVDIIRTLLILLVCFSFVLSEIAKVYDVGANVHLELVDFSGEGNDTSEGEEKEDTVEEKTEKKVNPGSSISIKDLELMAMLGAYRLSTYQPDDYQEIPQPPPEA